MHKALPHTILCITHAQCTVSAFF